MFEATPDQFEAPGPTESGALQAISWPALVARLAAQRDLRRVLMARDGSGFASFNAGAAAWLSRNEALAGENKRDVNPDALVDSKQAEGNTGVAATGAAAGDRETQ